MAEKSVLTNIRRSRPPTRVIFQTQRSRSIDNGKMHEPPLQSIHLEERKLSVTSNGNIALALPKRSRVSRLRNKFEQINSSNNDLSCVVKQSVSFSRTIPSPSVHTLLDKIPTPPVQPDNRITTVSSTFIRAPHPSRTSIESRITPNLHNTRDFIINKSILTDDTTNITNLTDNLVNSSNSMIPSTPQISLTSEELPSSDGNNNPSDNLNISITSNDVSSNASSTNEENDFNVNKKRNSFKPLEEVYDTEQTYISKLHVLAYKLPMQVKETCTNEENLMEIFRNIYEPLQKTLKKLYKFHSGIILRSIEQYKDNHRTNNNIWSIFQDHSQTIEELYKAYYVTYDENQCKLERLCKMYPLINKAMLQCQVYLDNLYPIGELNCANQRLLRYILLMKNYMKHLDENSSEYQHTSFIHDELTRIATRCEEHLAISPTQIKRLKAQFDTKPECFDHQQLIWHGLLKKQSSHRRTDIVQAYIILFSNSILISRKSGNKLELKRQFSIENVTVEIIQGRRLAPTTFPSAYGQHFNAIAYYPFRVNTPEKAYEFLVDKEQDREKWINSIKQAKEDFYRRNLDVEVRLSRRPSNEDQLGLRAPTWVNNVDITRCQTCHDRFGTKLISGRHHCRSCGRCICTTCSTKKLILNYCNNDGEQRVCDICYTHFTGVARISNLPAKILRNPDRTILFGDFHCISSNSIVWIDLQEDYRLHIYGAQLDQLEDYSIDLTNLHNMSFVEKTRTFILDTQDKLYKFSLDLNHRIVFQENDDINKTVKSTNNKLLFYGKLWYDSMQAARSKTVLSWYKPKRISADSGIVAVE